MSAPCLSGWIRNGVATVLSTMRGTPDSCAAPATAAMSRMWPLGLAIVSAKYALVLGRVAAFHSARSSGFSTNETSMPSFGSV